MSKLANCKTCNKKLRGKQRMFCSNKCKCKDSNARIQNYAAQQQRGLERKLRFILEKGGKCQRCGYNKNLAALCFHHRKPEEKSFGLDMRRFANNNLNKVIEEVAKCDLLCANCHAEEHSPESDINNFDT